MSGALLEIRDLRLRLRIDGELRPVLRGVDLTVGPGECVGLVGESGSGKSMTARSVIRMLPAGAELSGSVELGGASVTALSARELRACRASRVAMIFQEPRAHIDPVRTIGDHVTEALRLRDGAGRRQARVDAEGLLEAVRLESPRQLMARYPHELSGGMLQRVMIAGALACDPELLLADEPTTALDVTTQAEVVAILSELQEERSLGVLFISHDLELAAAICDRIAVMYAGEIVEESPAAVLHDAPLHPYTAGLLASRPSLIEDPAPLAVIPGQPISRLRGRRGLPVRASLRYRDEICDRVDPARRRVDVGVVAATTPRRCGSGSAPGRHGREGRGRGQGRGPLQDLRAWQPAARRRSTTSASSFERGGSIAIVGESGSGKTTVARCLTGLERPTAGTIEVCGRARGEERVSARLRRSRAREMQMIFQDPYASLNPRFRIGQAVARTALLHGTAPDGDTEAYAEALMKRVGLPATTTSAYPRQLSGGQRQRAAIACALAVEPEVLVLDEAVAALDLSIQAQVLNLLSAIRSEGEISFVFISHDLSVVRQISETIVVMCKGEVVEAGRTRDVLRDPQHPYTQRLIASVPRPGWDPHVVLGRAPAPTARSAVPSPSPCAAKEQRNGGE